MNNQKFSRGWNWFWMILAGVLTIYNLITIVYSIYNKHYVDFGVTILISIPVAYIFIVSLRRVLKYWEEKDGEQKISGY